MNEAARKLVNPGLDVETSKPDDEVVVLVRSSKLGVVGSGASADHASAKLIALLDCMGAAARRVADVDPVSV